MPRKPNYVKYDRSGYINSWMKDKTKAFTFKFYLKQDADVIGRLDSQKSKRGYIIHLIRDDIKNNE